VTRRHLPILSRITARGESLTAFDGRCIPAVSTPTRLPRRGPRGCVAPPSNIPDYSRSLLSKLDGILG
jgi:hypothetical protein